MKEVHPPPEGGTVGRDGEVAKAEHILQKELDPVLKAELGEGVREEGGDGSWRVREDRLESRGTLDGSDGIIPLLFSGNR
ncbi:hypothetical protein chiPu_0032907 [Chiloscyllium punctatum]|uniref:Uncharacterized protein n=1 Tax=Chiloscyllium punctatum TaxID=137246 RepID=A0A401U1D9_CHIPU|nr:hypothetical protein [Chiloscyllium punctatum]